MTQHRGSNFWISTYTGKKFAFDNPHPDDICIEDIAHALSLICRFNGHCEQHYSVAQHSVLVSHLETENQLEALFHDAVEAYTGDLTRPFKHLLKKVADSFYEDLEYWIYAAICHKFNLNSALSFKQEDTLALQLEKNQVNKNWKEEWDCDVQLDQSFKIHGSNLTKIRIQPLHPAQAEQQFLSRFNKLWQIKN